MKLLLATIVSLLHSHRRHCSSPLLPNSVCVPTNSLCEHKKPASLAGFPYLGLDLTRRAALYFRRPQFLSPPALSS